MGDKFELVTAFSREGAKKVYVQHRLKEHAKDVNELLEKKAYFYVCGDAANMAREVNTVLSQILAEQRGISDAKAEEIVKNMRAANQYQVRFLQRQHASIGNGGNRRNPSFCPSRAPEEPILDSLSILSPSLRAREKTLTPTCNRRTFGRKMREELMHSQQNGGQRERRRTYCMANDWDKGVGDRSSCFVCTYLPYLLPGYSATHENGFLFLAFPFNLSLVRDFFFIPSILGYTRYPWYK